MGAPVVFIHGLWLHATSWQPWVDLFRENGYAAIAPGWAHEPPTVEEARNDPDAVAGLGIDEITEHYATIIRALPEPPIIIGHSFGGLTTQILLDRGLGACGVAIDSAPPKGVKAHGLHDFWVAFRALLPVLVTPFSWKKVLRMSLDSFAYGWVHTLSPEEQRKAWEGYVVPSPGRPFWQNTLASDLTKINFQNGSRAPLLLTAGELDRSIPASMSRDNFEKYKGSKAVTDFKEFPGRTHWIIKQPGWEEVAGYAIEWVEKQIGKP